MRRIIPPTGAALNGPPIRTIAHRPAGRRPSTGGIPAAVD